MAFADSTSRSLPFFQATLYLVSFVYQMLHYVLYKDYMSCLILMRWALWRNGEQAFLVLLVSLFSEKTQQTNNYVKLSSLRVNFLKVVRSRKSERKKEQNKFSWAWGLWRVELGVRDPASSWSGAVWPVNHLFSWSKMNLSDLQRVWGS